MTLLPNSLATPAIAAALGLSLLTGVAFADSHSDMTDDDAMAVADEAMMIDDEMAAEVQQAIALLPPDNLGTSFGLIDVRAEDGMLVLSGFVQGNAGANSIERLLQDVEGLDMDKVSNEIVVQ